MKFLSNLKEKVVNVGRIVQTVVRPFKVAFLQFNHKKKIVIIASVFFAIVVLFFGVKSFVFKSKTKGKEEIVAKVKVAKIKKGDFSQKYSVMGTIKGAVENDLRFEIEGALSKYNYKEGTRIYKGSIIAYLDPKDAMTKLSYAKSKYESEKAAYFSAQQKLKVYEDLYKLKAVSESKLIETRFEVEAIRQRMGSAMAELELAQSNLLKTNLFAPSNGILADIIVQSGEFVTPNDIVAKFVSIGDANLEVEISESDVGQVRIGLKTKVFCDAYRDKEFNGAVFEISPIVKERTRSVVVKIRLPNEQGLLRSGMFARGEILLLEAVDVIAVPSDSIVSLGVETKLLPIVKPTLKKQNQGIVELRHIQVSTGTAVEKSIVVTDGVKEGELYITETSGELSDGILVEYMEPVEKQ